EEYRDKSDKARVQGANDVRCVGQLGRDAVQISDVDGDDDPGGSGKDEKERLREQHDGCPDIRLLVGRQAMKFLEDRDAQEGGEGEQWHDVSLHLDGRKRQQDEAAEKNDETEPAAALLAVGEGRMRQ